MSAVATRPRVGFLGVGWIGRNRMEALRQAELVDVAAVADPALDGGPTSLDELLEVELDAVVIATPSALHAEQATRALEHGLHVFCQKPLGRDARETRAVVAAARDNDRLLDVDLSYRKTEAARRCRELVRAGAIGSVYAAELVFHNAYGPDKAWFYDRELAGGGCVIDLGIHLVDLALWTLDFPRVEDVSSRLLAHGGHDVEDYAVARLDLAGGATVSIACSWNLPVGRDAVIGASFYGTVGSVAFENVGGSFYDFHAERAHHGAREPLAEPPDAWGGRAICAWAEKLAGAPHFDPSVEHVVEIAAVLDRIYGRPA